MTPRERETMRKALDLVKRLKDDRRVLLKAARHMVYERDALDDDSYVKAETALRAAIAKAERP